MFKNVMITSAIVSLSSASPLSTEFMSGLQTGAFITNADHFDDYSCPEPEMNQDMERYLNMMRTAKSFLAPKDGAKNKKSTREKNDDDILEKLDRYADEVGVIISALTDKEYDGGDFC